MDKLNADVLNFFVGMASAPPPPVAIPGADPSSPASPEERAYWIQLNAAASSMDCFVSSTAASSLQGTELFRYPSKDGTYEIESRFFRCTPLNGGEKPPLIIYFHSGGMTLLHRDLDFEVEVCATLRQCGVSVLSVEFRNAREHHFPAGVDDAVSTLQWARANQEILGFDGAVVTAGCSGGGNLSIATFVRALELGLPARELLDGIVADAPFLRPAYLGVDKLEAVFSPMTSTQYLQDMVNNYTSSRQDYENPSAWPLLASNDILLQFPPTMLRGQEFDVLCIDAKDFYDKLVDAGVEGCSFAERKNMIHAQPYFEKFAGKIDRFTAIAEWAQFAKTMALLNKLSMRHS